MFTLSWQPPYDWSWMLGFLAARAVDGVENGRRGLLCAQPGGGRASRTDQREPPSAHPHCAGQRERRITSRRAGVSGEGFASV